MTRLTHKVLPIILGVTFREKIVMLYWQITPISQYKPAATSDITLCGIYSFDDTIGWGIYRFDAFVYNLAVIFKKNNLCTGASALWELLRYLQLWCYYIYLGTRVFGESAALIVGETISQQFLEHCQNCWGSYSFGK